MQRAAAIARDRAQSRQRARLAAGDYDPRGYPAADPAMFVSEGERDSISYAFGEDIGYNVRSSRMPVQIAHGLRRVCARGSTVRPHRRPGVHEYLQYYFMVKRPAENAAASGRMARRGRGKKSGVKKTESGLLYKVVKAGDKELKATDDRDVVSVHYKGTTRDGQRVRRFALCGSAGRQAGDAQALQSRGLRQGRARAVPAQPGDSRLDRGHEARRQGR